jgi:hypothetical protein
MATVSGMRRWERWGMGEAVVLKGALASFALPRLAGELYGERALLAARALTRIAASPSRPAADRALRALAEACEDPRAAGTVIDQCLLMCGDRGDEHDRTWSSVAAPLLLEGAPPRLVRFLDHGPVAGEPWPRPEDIVDRLMMCVSFDSPRRPDLERFLSTTDQPLILDALAARWSGDTSLPNRIVVDVTVANPHVVPPDSGRNVLLAVAKDRLDLIDFTRAQTADALFLGTRLSRDDLADEYRRALRALPPGAARERLCYIASCGERGVEEAVAAVIEAGYAPEGRRDRAVFLYLTEQWDRYDAVDPDGELLYAAYADLHRSSGHGAHSRKWSILHTARRNGRPDPAVRYLEENPVSGSGEPDRRRGSAGGYGSDYGGGDYGGGGGWSGGGFHT